LRASIREGTAVDPILMRMSRAISHLSSSSSNLSIWMTSCGQESDQWFLENWW